MSGAGEARRGASATSDYAASEDADWSAASPGLRPRRVGGGAGVVREAMSRAAAEAILGEHEDDRRADPTARDLPSSAHLVPADVRGAAFHDAARLSRRGDDSDSEDDRAALARLNDWEEDAGVAPAARRAKARGVVRSYVGDDHRGGVSEYSSDEDDRREAALAEARERKLAALRRDDQRAVASSRVSADAFARAVAAADVPPSDRELFLSEDVEEQHAESFFRTGERDGGEGDRRGRAVERTRRDRDASPGRARPGGVRREPSSGPPPDPSRAFDPGTSSPGGEGERAREPRGGGFDPVEVRVRRFERPPPPRRGLDPENDPYRSLGPRRRRSGSAEAEWREVVPPVPNRAGAARGGRRGARHGSGEGGGGGGDAPRPRPDTGRDPGGTRPFRRGIGDDGRGCGKRPNNARSGRTSRRSRRSNRSRTSRRSRTSHRLRRFPGAASSLDRRRRRSSLDAQAPRGGRRGPGDGRVSGARGGFRERRVPPPRGGVLRRPRRAQTRHLRGEESGRGC